MSKQEKKNNQPIVIGGKDEGMSSDNKVLFDIFNKSIPKIGIRGEGTYFPMHAIFGRKVIGLGSFSNFEELVSEIVSCKKNDMGITFVDPLNECRDIFERAMSYAETILKSENEDIF